MSKICAATDRRVVAKRRPVGHPSFVPVSARAARRIGHFGAASLAGLEFGDVFCVDCLTLPMKFRPSDPPHGLAGRRICLPIAPRGLFVAGCDCGWGDARPTDPVSVVVFVRSLCGFCVDGVDFAAWHSFAATGPDEDRPFASLRRGLLLCVARILPQVRAGIAAGYGRRCCCDPGQCDMRMVVAGNPIAFPARICVARRLVAGRRGADGDDRVRCDIAGAGRRHAPQDPG